MLEKNQMLALLKADVIPALGCTEPVCVALCAAYAAKMTEGTIRKIEITVNPNVYKNGMAAGIPNSTQAGLKAAAALGAVLKKPEKGLELLEDITEETHREAQRLLREKAVLADIKADETFLYVRCVVQTDAGSGECIIRNEHTNVVFLRKNEEILSSKENVMQQQETHSIEELTKMTFAQIRALVDTASAEELSFMLDGVVMNEQLASYSEAHPSGVGLASVLRSQIKTGLLGNGLLSRTMLQVVSAAESRLDGCPYPTMSSSGSGTKGVGVILPIHELAKEIGSSPEQEMKALAFGHLLNRYMNFYIGKLAAMCACSVASCTAAAAAMTWLLGGNDEQIGYAVRNMTGSVPGMICDGGKVGCAMKVASASAAALLSAFSAIQNTALRVSDGICAETPEQCVKNIARIANPGMLAADREILHIMLEKEDLSPLKEK